MHSPSGEFLSGESHGQKNLVVYSPWGLKESDTSEHAHMKQKWTHGQREQTGVLRGGEGGGGMVWEVGVSRCSF